jgi:ankyrin repeat protein
LLLKKGADPNVGEPSPLYASCLAGNSELVQLFLEFGGDLYNNAFQGLFPIEELIKGNHVHVLKELSRKTTLRLDNVSSFGKYPVSATLLNFVIEEHLDILFDNGKEPFLFKISYIAASTLAKTSETTLLHLAAETGSLELIRHLIENKHFPFDSRDKFGSRAIDNAFASGNWDCVCFIFNT